jgi:hypothetical protein
MMRAERITTDPTRFLPHSPEGRLDPPALVDLHHGTISCEAQAVNDPPTRPVPGPPSAGFAWLLAEASVYHDPADHGWSRVR